MSFETLPLCVRVRNVNIKMALQSDLIKAVFTLGCPGHFILWPTFNFKLKPLVPLSLQRSSLSAEDVSLAKQQIVHL